MILTQQKFTFTDKETGDKRHFLLMQEEFELMQKYIETFPEKTMEDIFEIWTGKDASKFINIRIEVIYL